MVARSLFCLVFLSSLAWAQDGQKWQIDFLAGYYDQDGDHSAVTGGEGTEELQSTSPIFDITFRPNGKWTHSARVGFDNVTSASIDAMDHVSGASRQDTRAFVQLGSTRQFERLDLGAAFGFSKEYDYTSISAGFNFSMDFNQKNTTIAASVMHYEDTVELYDIDGVVQGEDDRSTNDVTLSISQVMGKRSLLSLEYLMSDQSGFLSSPFQEVILDDGRHVAEWLPDNRLRQSLTAKWNQAYSSRFVVRHSLRTYTDDFEIDATSFEIEPFFKLFPGKETWVSLGLRYHSQDGSPYFVLPGEASIGNAFATADRDLSTFDSTRVSLGFKMPLNLRWADRFQTRLAYYDRDDGLNSFTVSFGFGWSQ